MVKHQDVLLIVKHHDVLLIKLKGLNYKKSKGTRTGLTEDSIERNIFKS